LFPNPANKHVKITGLTNLENYTIYSITGALMSKGTISNEELIDITELNNGLYFLKIKNGNTLRFLKK
jgi:hypothetical protein